MSGDDRRRDVIDRFLQQRERVPDLATALCRTSVDVLGVDGAGILLRDNHGNQVPIGSSDPVMGELEALQHLLGEGPCVDAYRFGRPVHAHDLRKPGPWPQFRQEAIRLGVRSMFGYPMGIGQVCLGALNLYSAVPRPLDEDQMADAPLVAEVTTHALLAGDGPGNLDELSEYMTDLGQHQINVYQATGMVAAQLDLPIDAAFARLRAHAFAADLPLSEVASLVVERQLRLEP